MNKFTEKAGILKLLILTLFILLTLSSCFINDYDMTLSPLSEDKPCEPMRGIIDPNSEVRGVWIASVYNIDYPSKPGLSADELKNEIDSILDTCEKNKLNTVFFQVRPSCDALYESDIFPISRYISDDGKLAFDPLRYIVTEAHQRNIFVHAWVNPLRVTMNTHDISTLDDKNPAKIHPEWTVAYDDGKLYLNAGIPEVGELVADGVREIVEKYDVDGIVFDDYFYPYPVYGEDGKLAGFADEEEFKQYGSSFDSVEDWRRDNINRIIRLVYETVHKTDPECVFGVSPFAIWQNSDGKNGGSNTKGFEGYNSLYCDALAWIEGGYVDYISPQIYWKFDDKSAPFDVLTRWWNAKLDGSRVKLYVSHAAYRYEDGNWENPAGQLREQVEFARSEKAYHGSVFYGYDEIKRNTNGASDDILAAYENEIIYTEIQSNSKGITITSPEYGYVSAEDHVYIIGSSDPYYVLTVNGEKISRTKSGLFNMYVELNKGKNSFVFEENGEIFEYIINYDPSSGSSTVKKEPEPISLGSLTIVNTTPAKNVTTKSNKLYVSCVAPVNSTIKVDIGGVVTALTAEKVNKYASSGYTGVVYSGEAALPEIDEESEADGGAAIKDCGNIKFTLTHRDGNTEAEGARVRLLSEDGVIKVQVKNDYTHLKITEASSYYNDYTVQSAGMTDYAVSEANGFYKLNMGGYISTDSAEEVGIVSKDDIIPAKITSAQVKNGGESTEFVISCTEKPAYNGCIDENGRFVVTFYGLDPESAPDAIIDRNPILKSCEVVRLTDKVRYSFELHAVENFYGFDLEYTDGATVVSLRNPIVIDETSPTPLDGIDIILDAGHGGKDNGAAGAASTTTTAAESGTASGTGETDSRGTLHEKDLNLKITLAAAVKLQSLGANVSLTREDDTTFDLYGRMAFLEEAEPDLCVSIHQNSMGYSADITRIRGTLALWCMDGGAMLSDCVGQAVAAALGRYYRGSQYQMLAMCRNPKFPQALIETGFITSVEEYEQLLSDDGIEKAAEGVCQGILNWFKKQAHYANL